MMFRLTNLLLCSSTFFLGLVFFWVYSDRPSKDPVAPPPNANFASVATVIPAEDVLSLPAQIDDRDLEETRTEYFSDDKQIGRRKKNKIEIRCFSNRDGRFAQIKFFSRSEYGAWFEVQSFRFEKDGLSGCDPIVDDFNNDGFKDFTYQSTVAARGANEVRRLFIYDEKQDELVYIKNSEEYPNLAYNKRLNCVDAFLVYGATSTVFLRIEGDMLREFASVDTGEELVVSLTDKSGEKRVVSRRKMNPDNFEELFRRFSSYSPLR